MAELIVRVENGGAFEDGDVVLAPNDRATLACHASRISNVRATGFNSDGLRPDSLPRRAMDLLYRYRFDRISETEVRRTDRFHDTYEVLSGTPNGHGEYIDVVSFLRNRRRSNRHTIFGSEGSEFWFGGKVKGDAASVSLWWDLIEGETPHRRADHKKWPLSQVEESHFCALSVADFSEGSRKVFEAPGQEIGAGDPDFPAAHGEAKALVLARLCRVNYMDLPDLAGAIKNKMSNREQSIDVRDFAQFVPEEIVQVKGL